MLACLGRQRHRTLGAGSISVASQDFKLHHSEMPQRMSSRATAPPSSPCPCRRIKRAGALLAAASPPPPERFVDDSPLEGAVTSELVSEMGIPDRFWHLISWLRHRKSSNNDKLCPDRLAE